MALILSPIILGYPAFQASSVTTFSCSAANSWFSVGFVARVSKQISKIIANLSGTTGSLDGDDSVCELYNDSSGKPGTSIEARNTVTATPSGAGTVEFTGFTSTSTLTDGVQYWLVFKNAAVSPGTNYMTYRTGAADTAPVGYASFSTLWGWCNKSTTDGSTWSGGARGIVPCVRIEYSDGSFDGLPVTNITAASSAATGRRVYGKAATGVKFTTPANVKLRVRGGGFVSNKIGTPDGDSRIRWYSGSTRLATSLTIPKVNMTTFANVAHLASVLVLDPSTTYRMVLSDTAQTGASSSNAYGLGLHAFHNDSNSRTLLPLGGVQTYTADETLGSISWTDDTDTLPWALLLDDDSPFDSVGGGGGMLIHPGMMGGIRG